MRPTDFRRAHFYALAAFVYKVGFFVDETVKLFAVLAAFFVAARFKKLFRSVAGQAVSPVKTAFSHFQLGCI